MLRLLGIPISDDDGRHLVATLLVEGTPDALSAGAQLSKGVERDLYAVGLTREERTAVLACLEDPPDGLVELRGALDTRTSGQGGSARCAGNGRGCPSCATSRGPRILNSRPSCDGCQPAVSEL